MNKTGHSGPIVFLEVDPPAEPFLKGLCPPAWPARFYRDEADLIDLKKNTGCRSPLGLYLFRPGCRIAFNSRGRIQANTAHLKISTTPTFSGSINRAW